MSETGSFHLAPPPAHPAQPAQPQAPGPLPAHAGAPHVAQDLAHATTAAVPYGAPPTRAYTAGHLQDPGSAVLQPTPVRRPGPSPKVAVPVLVVALICFAVGIWALTQA